MRPRTHRAALPSRALKSIYYIVHVLLGVFVNVLKYERRLHRAQPPAIQSPAREDRWIAY